MAPPHGSHSSSASTEPTSNRDAQLTIESQKQLLQQYERQRQFVQQQQRQVPVSPRKEGSIHTAATSIAIDDFSESQTTSSGLFVPEDVRDSQQKILDHLQQSQGHLQHTPSSNRKLIGAAAAEGSPSASVRSSRSRRRSSSSRPSLPVPSLLNEHHELPSSFDQECPPDLSHLAPPLTALHASQPQAAAAARPSSMARSAYTRHQSRAEWQEKQSALRSSSSTSATTRPSHMRRAPQSPGDLQDWDEVVAQQARELAAVSGRAGGGASAELTSSNNSFDVDELIIEKRLPSQFLRSKSSSGGINTSSGHLSMNGDYAVEGHKFVGAYHVNMPAEDLQHPSDHLTARDNSSTRSFRPPAVVEQRALSTSDSQSTITPQTNPAEESVRARRASYSCAQEPTPLPIPETIEGGGGGGDVGFPTATRIRIVTPSEQGSQRDCEGGGTANNDDDGKKEPQEHPAENRKSGAHYVSYGFAFTTVLCVICFLILEKIFGWVNLFPEKKDQELPTPAPTNLPTMSPTFAPPSPFPTLTPTQNALSILPGLETYTVDAIHNDPSSPQRQAYEWILVDSELNQEFPKWRLLQRFALMTIYYAGNRRGDTSGYETRLACEADEQGVSWSSSANWKSHTTSECQWQNSNDVFAPYQRCRNGQYESLDLRSNCLEGYVPREIALLSNLRFLDLAGNALIENRQALPTELGLLTNLEEFRLHSMNQIRSDPLGTIPTELGRLTKLTKLQLYDGDLTGEIPSELGLVTALQQLWLYNNDLEGLLPSEVGHLFRYQLTNLRLSENQMTGTLPEEMFQALDHRRAYDGSGFDKILVKLARNEFTGTVPQNFCAPKFATDCEPQGGLCGCTTGPDPCPCSLP